MVAQAFDRAVPSSAFLRLAAFCALLYVAAQLFQAFALRSIRPVLHGPDGPMLARLLAADEARRVAILLAFAPLIVAYAGAAMHAFRRSPAAAFVGFVFAILFVFIELSYRSIDFFLVTREWAHAFRDSGDAGLRALLSQRVAMWGRLVNALYFPLLLSHALAAVFLGRALWSPSDRSSQAMSLLFALKAGSVFARILEMHAGLQWLQSVNAAVYLPITLATFGFLSVWLWRQAKSSTAGILVTRNAP